MNRAVASIGSALHLKPIIFFREDGTLTLADKSIGKVRAMHSMPDKLSALHRVFQRKKTWLC